MPALGGYFFIDAYGKNRNHSSSLQLLSSEINMRQGRDDSLTEGDRRRFEEIFLPHLDAAYNLARWIIQDHQDAQDVVQDAYIRAFRGFHRFRGENSKAWFLTIVRNTAYNCLNCHAPETTLICG
jgi:hypothetical protein